MLRLLGRRRCGCALGSTRVHLRYGLYTILAAAVFFFTLSTLLPYDSSFRQAVRFNLERLWRAAGPQSYERWVFAPPAFPVDLGEDVLIVAKTGYGTRHRMKTSFEALSPRSELRDFFLIADYASKPGDHLVYRGEELPVHDAVQETLNHVPVSEDNPRVGQYQSLIDAIRVGDEELALRLSKKFGWELDAMKDISGLQLAYGKFPLKKWYILLDDDTYIVQPSLKALLGHLDSSHPYYLGNAVGDYRARFAHGGSAIILSQASMRMMFTDNPVTTMIAHRESLSTIWGDRLIARALVRIGVFLDERFSHFFSGEAPEFSKIQADRLCSPILSFHGLASASSMIQTGSHFQSVEKPFLWIRLWDVYEAPSPWRHGLPSTREGWDHVGRPDDAVAIVNGVSSADGCAKECDSRPGTCMAWTWESISRDCLMSPWMMVGEKAAGKTSGINAQRARKLEADCVEYAG